MNRKERRAARGKARHDKFFDEYARHLPQDGAHDALQPERMCHVAVRHGDWCAIFKGNDCSPDVTYHVLVGLGPNWDYRPFAVFKLLNLLAIKLSFIAQSSG
jgi:hypothetical protein